MSTAWPPLLEPDAAFVGRPMNVEEWLLRSEDEQAISSMGDSWKKRGLTLTAPETGRKPDVSV